METNINLNIGDIIHHDTLGRGEVVDIYAGDECPNYIDIHFDFDQKKYKVHTFRPDTLEPHLVKE